MPDISMCMNMDCPSKFKCYRSVAIPSYWQSYQLFRYGDDGQCGDFIPVASAVKEEPIG